MLTVTHLSGVTEALTDYSAYEEYEEVNGAFTVSFASFFTPQNAGHTLLTEESIVTNEDGHEFRVKQVETNRHVKNVEAIHVYFDNIDKRKYDIYGGTHTLNEFLAYVLAGTGWSFTNVDVIGSVLIPNFGEDNVVKLIDVLLTAFECEMKINANRTLTFAKQIGGNNDTQYRYGHNVKAIKESIDTTKLTTYIEGYGADNLKVTYTSPNANIFGIRHAEPIFDDQYATSESLLEHIRRELVDNPEVSIELDAVELQERALGESVWLIYEPLGIEFQTRVLTKTTRIPKQLSTITLGNAKPANIDDILAKQRVTIDENAKESRSKIEQTNDRITLSVTELGGRLGNAESTLQIHAGEISSRVTYTDYNGATITSKITQDPYSISLLAQNLNLQGLVTFTNLNTPGAAVIDGGNIYGSQFQVGRGTGSTLTMTSTLGSHTLISNDANGFAVQSNGSLSLRAGSGYAIFTRFAPLAVQDGFRVDGGISQFNTNVTVNATLNASFLQVQGSPVATQAWVAANFAPK